MDIREVIREEIALSRQQAGYGTNLVPIHTHNGIDSPQLSVNSLKPFIYTGYIVSAAFAGGSAGTPFPPKWTLSVSGGGAYTVTHNLNTTNYIVLLTCRNNNTGNGNVIQLVSRGSTTFVVQIYNGGVTASDWMFALILLN